MKGGPFRQAARESDPRRRTISRWWHRLQARFSCITQNIINAYLPIATHHLLSMIAGADHV